MRITRIEAKNFRGWRALDMAPNEHLLVVGEPRAGSSDLLEALRRVLDPASTRAQPRMVDLHQIQVEGPALDGAPPPTIHSEVATVEITLTDLPPDVEAELFGRLEPVGDDGRVLRIASTEEEQSLALRIGYCVDYNDASEELNHRVYFPLRSDVMNRKFDIVPTSLRRTLPVTFVGSYEPLQLRAEGKLRGLAAAHGEPGLVKQLRAFQEGVSRAALALTVNDPIGLVLDDLANSAGPLASATNSVMARDDFLFLPDDGSIGALLRATQPLLRLDDAGHLPLAVHGSTTSRLVAVAEAMLEAASDAGAIVIAGDLGEGVDGRAAGSLAHVLRSAADQVLVTTRRAEVAQAFHPSEIVRLTRHRGSREVHAPELPRDAKGWIALRHLYAQLLPAMSASTILIVEGRHDINVLQMANRLAVRAAPVQLVSTEDSTGGGTGQIPRLARLAKSLGFRVLVLVDGDPEKYSDHSLRDIVESCDVTISLPERVAIERALIVGIECDSVRGAADVFEEFGSSNPMAGSQGAQALVDLVKFLHKKGLHAPLLQELHRITGGLPPLVEDLLRVVCEVADPRSSASGLVRLEMPNA